MPTRRHAKPLKDPPHRHQLPRTHGPGLPGADFVALTIDPKSQHCGREAPSNDGPGILRRRGGRSIVMLAGGLEASGAHNRVACRPAEKHSRDQVAVIHNAEGG